LIVISGEYKADLRNWMLERTGRQPPSLRR
jgi:hypothetical protein